MIVKQKIPYTRCIFVCVNDREAEKPSCGDQQGETVFHQLRALAKGRGLHPRIRVTQAKCLGQCALGVTVMIYPEQVWYSGVTSDNVNEIVEEIFAKTLA